MNNPHNKLVTKQIVENILNYYGPIGDNNEPLSINNLEHYQKAFVNETYYQSIQNDVLNNNVKDVYINYIPTESNEKLEYGGDRILKAIMGRYLRKRFPDGNPKFYTRLQIEIEQTCMLHKFAKELNFSRYLLLSIQAENQTICDVDRGRHTSRYYEDAFEAFIGAIMDDFDEKGYIYADRFVVNIIENLVDFPELIEYNNNFIDSLQRFFQASGWSPPTYQTLNEVGPLYRKVFTRVVCMSKHQLESLDDVVKINIQNFTNKLIKEYKKNDRECYLQLCDLYDKDFYVIGIGKGKKVSQANQECAKCSLINLQLSLNY